MKAFKEIYKCQAKLFMRDRVTLILTILIPLALGIFFSLLFSSFDVQKVRILLVDEDGEKVTQYMIDKIIESNSEKISFEKVSPEQGLDILEKGKAEAVMIFQKGSSDAIIHGGKSIIKAYYHPNRIESAGIASQIINTIVAEINLGIVQAEKVFTSEHLPVVKKQKSLAEFYLPNFLAISVLWLSLFATALPLVKHREQKILLQLGITPLSPITFMFANTLWRLTIGILQSLLFVLVGIILLKIPIFNHIFLFLFAIVFGNLTFIAMGYMIAAISTTTQRAEIITQLFNFIMMFLSGVFFTTDMLPDFVLKISYFIPLTYLADLYRQVMVEYQKFLPMWLDFLVIIGSGLFFSAIALKFWSWK